MIRRSYLPALALCTVVWGPASAEVVDQGSYSQTGDIYSQGMTAQGGPWAGDTYSQGMMMSKVPSRFVLEFDWRGLRLE